jgi:hypothetical protein
VAWNSSILFPFKKVHFRFQMFLFLKTFCSIKYVVLAFLCMAMSLLWHHTAVRRKTTKTAIMPNACWLRCCVCSDTGREDLHDTRRSYSVGMRAAVICFCWGSEVRKWFTKIYKTGWRVLRKTVRRRVQNCFLFFCVWPAQTETLERSQFGRSNTRLPSEACILFNRHWTN